MIIDRCIIYFHEWPSLMKMSCSAYGLVAIRQTSYPTYIELFIPIIYIIPFLEIIPTYIDYVCYNHNQCYLSIFFPWFLKCTPLFSFLIVYTILRLLTMYKITQFKIVTHSEVWITIVHYLNSLFNTRLSLKKLLID